MIPNSKSLTLATVLHTRSVIENAPWISLRASPKAQWVKNPPAMQETLHTRDKGSISGSGGFPGEGNGNPIQYSCLKIPWTEEPDRPQSKGLQRVRHN